MTRDGYLEARDFSVRFPSYRNILLVAGVTDAFGFPPKSLDQRSHPRVERARASQTGV